ncbi:MAG TPA: B12-binding domain-containing radical SAM protein [Dehalococcoidia bacterium]|nr:B12-binding domain-containing radical SAM protein [Dehalococcoidia bacterium]
MAKKLLMINPVQQVEHQEFWNESAVRIMQYPATNLAYLAALTPPGWDIKIIDETIESLTFEDADLVGITALTPTAPRAYAISEQYRRKGIKTVIGGIHASFLRDEAIQFADCVVIGEAESVWQNVIHDFERNELKRFYTGEHTSLENLAIPRRDLLSNRYALKLGGVETARGCPNDCEFCSVTAFNGRKYRARPVEQVLDELEAIDSKNIFFSDNTILGYGKQAEQRAIQLFRGMVDRGLNKRWFSQVNIDIAYSPKVLEWAKKSGCSGLAIGFESISEDALQAMHKVRNLKVGVAKYKEGVKRVHDYGIPMAGAFVLGSDGDTKDVFQRTTEFILDSKVDATQITILTPLPGTRLFSSLQQEGRLLRTNYPDDWTHYDFTEVVFKPKHMTPDELMEGVTQIYRDTSSRPTSLKRAFISFIRTKNLYGTAIAYLWNRGSGSLWMQKYEYMKSLSLSQVEDASLSRPLSVN